MELQRPRPNAAEGRARIHIDSPINYRTKSQGRAPEQQGFSLPDFPPTHVDAHTFPQLTLHRLRKSPRAGKRCSGLTNSGLLCFGAGKGPKAWHSSQRGGHKPTPAPSHAALGSSSLWLSSTGQSSSSASPAADAEPDQVKLCLEMKGGFNRHRQQWELVMAAKAGRL